jgi:hypothetical protein
MRLRLSQSLRVIQAVQKRSPGSRYSCVAYTRLRRVLYRVLLGIWARSHREFRVRSQRDFGPAVHDLAEATKWQTTKACGNA